MIKMVAFAFFLGFILVSECKQVLFWGCNQCGVSGYVYPNSTSCTTDEAISNLVEHKFHYEHPGEIVTQTCATEKNIIFLTSSNKIYAVGDGDGIIPNTAVLGNSDGVSILILEPLHKVTKLLCHRYNAFFMVELNRESNSRNVWAFGNNRYGTLGLGTFDMQTNPVLIQAETSKIDTTAYSVVMLMKNGDNRNLYTAGTRVISHNLGHDEITVKRTYSVIDMENILLSNSDVKFFHIFSNGAFVFLENDEVFYFGDELYAMTGYDINDISIPTKIEFFHPNTVIKKNSEITVLKCFFRGCIALIRETPTSKIVPLSWGFPEDEAVGRMIIGNDYLYPKPIVAGEVSDDEEIIDVSHSMYSIRLISDFGNIYVFGSQMSAEFGNRIANLETSLFPLRIFTSFGVGGNISYVLPNAQRHFVLHITFECFGVKMSEFDACSGNGDCVGDNICSCYTLYYGNACDKYYDVVFITVITLSSIFLSFMLICFLLIVIVTFVVLGVKEKERIILGFEKVKEGLKRKEKTNLLENKKSAIDLEIEMTEREIEKKEERLSRRFSIQQLEAKEGNFALDQKIFTIKPEAIKKMQLIVENEDVEIFRSTWQGTPICFKEFNTIFLGKKVLNDLEKEIEICTSIIYPKIIRVYGASLDNNGKLGIVQEWCERGDVQTFMMMQQNEPLNSKHRVELSLKLRLRFLFDCALALDYLHSREILHVCDNFFFKEVKFLQRDLNPHHVLLKKNLEVRLSGFQLSKVNFRKKLKMTGRVGSNPKYIAPEVMKSVKYNEKCDVFSFGILFYEILTINFTCYKGICEKDSLGIYLINNPNLRPSYEGYENKVPPELISYNNSLWNGSPSKRPSFSKIKEYLKTNAVRIIDNKSKRNKDDVSFTQNILSISKNGNKDEEKAVVYRNYDEDEEKRQKINNNLLIDTNDLKNLEKYSSM